MDAFLRALRSPGAIHAVTGTAPSHRSELASDQRAALWSGATTKEDINEMPGYIAKKKNGILDRALDSVVRASGSATVFLIIQAVLCAWALVGIPFHDEQLWAIFISDAQAIFSYVFDSLLMRQQMNGHDESLVIAAEFRSRSETTHRMLTYLASCLGEDWAGVKISARNAVAVDIRLPRESRFTRMISWSATALGHIAFVAIYWACIVIWIAFGHSNGWSNRWQLYINSSTSALMVFVFSFLAILRERHIDYIRSCVDAIYKVDGLLELKLRRLTTDCVENQEFVIPAAKLNAVQRAINYYADVVGTLVGIAILIIVIVVWIAIGPALHFDSNWWLLIGTYAGLMGLNDGFVLRNIQAKLQDLETPQYSAIEGEDAALLESLQLDLPAVKSVRRNPISFRISERVNKICAHEVTVVLGVLLIFGLLIGSSVMQWSETGQLLCNIPPSIVESFFMIILITGHNSADTQKRVDIRNIFRRRLRLLVLVDTAGNVWEGDVRRGVVERWKGTGPEDGKSGI